MTSRKPHSLEEQEAQKRLQDYLAARKDPDPAAMMGRVKALLDSFSGSASRQAQAATMQAYDALPPSPTPTEIIEAEARAWSEMGRTAREAIALAVAPAGDASIMTVGELMTKPQLKVQYVVDGLIPAGGVTMLAGIPKVGKSTLARNLALAVAQGRGEWLGRSVARGPALYLTMEGREAAVAEHFRDMEANGGDPLHVGVWRDLHDPMAHVVAKIRETGAVLCVIDPLFRFLELDDGNDYAKATKATQQLIDVAAETGCAVVVVHHARKAGGQHGEEVLGSTGLSGMGDTNLILAKDDFGNRVVYSVQREGEEMPKTQLRFDAKRRWLYLGSTVEDAVEKRLEEEIEEVLRDSEPMNRGAIAKALKRRPGPVSKAIDHLLETGVVISNDPTVRHPKFRLA